MSTIETVTHAGSLSKFVIETHPDATPTERELDSELEAIHGRAMDAIMAVLHAESSIAGGLGDVGYWLQEVRELLSDIPVKVKNVANCAGNLIHAEEGQA